VDERVSPPVPETPPALPAALPEDERASPLELPPLRWTSACHRRRSRRRFPKMSACYRPRPRLPGAPRVDIGALTCRPGAVGGRSRRRATGGAQRSDARRRRLMFRSQGAVYPTAPSRRTRGVRGASPARRIPPVHSGRTSFKARFRLSLADAFAAALAKDMGKPSSSPGIRNSRRWKRKSGSSG